MITSAHERWGGKLLTVLTVVAAYAVLTHLPELERVLNTMAGARPGWLCLAAGLQVAYYLAFAWLYQRAFRTVDISVPVLKLTPVVLASVFVNFVAPHTGTAVFIEDAARRGHPSARAAAGAVLAAVADFGTFALVLIAGLAYLFTVHSLKPYEVVGAVAMGATVAGWGALLVLGLVRPSALRRLLEWSRAVVSWLGRRTKLRVALPDDWAERTSAEFAQSAALIARSRARVAATFAVALTAHVIDLVSLYAVSVAFGASLTPGAVVAAFSVGVLFWIVSVTPQGVGLVEGSMTLALVSLGCEPQAAAAIALGFRGLTFWLPLALGYIAVRHMPWARPAAEARAQPAGIRAIATLTAVMGVVNVVSAVTPSLGARLKALSDVLPLQVGYVGHLAAALAGFALIVLSGGLRRRKRAAWVLALIALTASIVSHLLKGLDYEEATLSLLLVIGLMIMRDRYHARSDPTTVRRALTILAASVTFTLLYGATGFYLLDRHYSARFGLKDAVEQTLIMFTSFHDPGLQPLTRFGRHFADSIYIVAACTLGYSLLGLLRPVVIRAPATPAERARARAIVEAHGRSGLARSTLLPDKSYHFSSGGSVTAYAVKGAVALALGDPIGPLEDAAAAIREFREYCAARDWAPAYYETLPDYLDLYQAEGLQALCIGHEAVVPAAEFTLEGKAGRSLRTPVNNFTKKGYRVELHEPPHSVELMAEMEEVSDDWLAVKRGAEKRFALGWFDEAYIQSCPTMAVHAPDGRVCAFANIVPEYRLNEVTIDLMRHDRTAERGTMDVLFVRLIEWARTRGYGGFSLGLAPLAGVGTEVDDPLIERALNYIFEHVNQFYNFRGLHAYKEKFHPEWSPRYLIHPNPSLLPAIWTAIVRADSGDKFPWSLRRLGLRPAPRAGRS